MSFLQTVFVTTILLFLFSCLITVRAANGGVHLFTGIIICLILVACTLAVQLMRY